MKSSTLIARADAVTSSDTTPAGVPVGWTSQTVAGARWRIVSIARPLASSAVLIDQTTLLRRARLAYAPFYDVATQEEATVLDAFVLARAAYRLGIAAPREGIEGPVRDKLEKATDGMERRLLDLRDRLRQIEAYRQLPAPMRAEIEAA